MDNGRLIITGATPKKDMIHIGYQKGVFKNVRVTKMSDGRFQIFKNSNHYKELSGHKVYSSISDIESDFDLNREIVTGV